MTSPSPYLTGREAMSYLKLGSTSALYRLIREHRMPFCRVGRSYRFDVRELDAWTHGHASALDQIRAERRLHRA
jgi:excisionase family DNA binding protein